MGFKKSSRRRQSLLCAGDTPLIMAATTGDVAAALSHFWAWLRLVFGFFYGLWILRSLGLVKNVQEPHFGRANMTCKDSDSGLGCRQKNLKRPGRSTNNTASLAFDPPSSVVSTIMPAWTPNGERPREPAVEKRRQLRIS